MQKLRIYSGPPELIIRSWSFCANKHWCDTRLLFDHFDKLFQLFFDNFLPVSYVFINMARYFTNSYSAISEHLFSYFWLIWLFNQVTHFSFKVSSNLHDNHNITLSQHFLFFFVRFVWNLSEVWGLWGSWWDCRLKTTNSSMHHGLDILWSWVKWSLLSFFTNIEP